MYDAHTYFSIVTFDTVMSIETEYFCQMMVLILHGIQYTPQGILLAWSWYLFVEALSYADAKSFLETNSDINKPPSSL